MHLLTRDKIFMVSPLHSCSSCFHMGSKFVCIREGHLRLELVFSEGKGNHCSVLAPLEIYAFPLNTENKIYGNCNYKVILITFTTTVRLSSCVYTYSLILLKYSLLFLKFK